MKLLLDTCAFLWLIRDDPKASPKARALFVDPANEVYLSAVSAWEIGVKYHAGKLPLGASPEIYVPEEREKHGIDTLALDEMATFELRHLPRHHADPFDRMLIAQAVAHQMAILTPDPLIHRYPIAVRW
jgi:PIN domain nuclease of toxin-antitoxin system